MKTIISSATPSQLETEALVAVVLNYWESSDKNNKDARPQLKVAGEDSAVQSAAADLLGSGELTGKAFE
ncbi:MAG TPA: hypothetical protein VND65_04905, partial [Candidatus Binatia bacterium]|nr:hypothetical protein [Candidatus Binatia bacterium]